MISISISIAFVLGFWISPAKIIGDLLAAIGMGGSLFGRAVIGQAIEYVIPAVLAFWLLNKATIRRRIVVSDRALWILRICNGISIAYVAIRLLAGLIPGGGPVFAVIQYGIVTIVPAIGISMFLLVQIAARAFGIQGRNVAVLVGTMLLVIPLLRSYLQKSQVEDIWDQYCQESGDRFLSQSVGFKSLQFQGMGEIEVFDAVVGQTYGAMHREFVGESLIKRGFLEEYENINPAARIPSKRIYFANGIQEEPLTNTRATHLVSISFPETKVPRFQRLRIVVKDAKTGLETAESNRVVDNITEKKRVCGEVKDGSINASDFVAKALNLAPLRR